MSGPAERPWRAGVIAAGWGERLRSGTTTLKPLVPVAGRTLVERVLASLAEVAPSEVVIIVNEASVAVRDHVSAARWPFPLRWIVETTPSSMHSFLRVIETLAAGSGPSGDVGAGDGPFLISTVDAIAPPGAFAAFGAASLDLDADLTLAVTTPPPGDEKPLLVRAVSKGRADSLGVEAIGAAAAGAPYATAGYYSVRGSVLREAEGARRDHVSALRLFLERLLTHGYRVAAVPVAAGVDVDRPGDIPVAEALLRQVGA